MNKHTAVKQNSLKIALAAALALGATVLSGSAAAADNASATASATVVTPIAITKATDMVFGSFIPNTTAGTIDVNTDSARTFTGGVTAAPGGATPAAARFNVTGEPSATYTIAYAPTVTLTGPGAPMLLTQVSDLTGAGAAATLVATGTLSAGGAQSIYVAGSLAVGANQVSGAYTGNITATVAYN